MPDTPKPTPIWPHADGKVHSPEPPPPERTGHTGTTGTPVSVPDPPRRG